jgi:hypothetical protein
MADLLKVVRGFLLGAAGATALLVALAGAVLVVTFGPSWWTDRALDRAVVVVADTWRDQGREAAEAQLSFELDAARIRAQVGEDACAWEEVQAQLRVSCRWSASVSVPLLGLVVDVPFRSVAQARSPGVLVP